jgi:hypothetical protein
MGAVTYPNHDVISFIDERFIPVKLHVEQQEKELHPYAVPFTPALFVLDVEGRQHRRLIGFHEPHDLIAELSLGWLVAALEAEEYDAAKERLLVALERTQHHRERAAEARYWDAVVTYRLTHDGLLAGWTELADGFQGTSWARKVEPFVRKTA